MNSHALISIITPVLNAEATLAESLESVVAQDYSRVEHLLIDAASSDRTLEIAARYPHLKVISESDRGIYDGMNKGANLASGEWLLFLQSDDWLPSGTLVTYQEAIRKNPSAMMICGGAEAVKNHNSRWTRIWSVDDRERKKLTVENIVLGEPMINARLIRRECFHQLGGFSLEYSLASDRDFLLRAVEADLKQVELSILTYCYRWHSGSSTMTEGNKLSERLSLENLAIARKYLTQIKGEDREIFKKWHSRLLVQKAMNAIESPGMHGLTAAVREGVAFDLTWPFQLIAEMARSLPGFLARGGKTKSRLLQEGKCL